MRHEKAAKVLSIARRMAASAEGMTLDEIAQEGSVDRRTAERMRDAIRTLFPQMEEIPDSKSKRFRIPGGLDGFMLAPQPEELAELLVAVRALEQSGATSRAAQLRSLAEKIQSALRPGARRKLAADVEALARAEGLVMQAGPCPLVNADTLAGIREAIMALRRCEFRYMNAEGTGSRQRSVVPYGLLFGRDYYLLGREEGKADPVLWRLDRIMDLRPGEACEGAPAGFDLSVYAARSFGTFQEPSEEVVLYFLEISAPDARRYRFHPTQELEPQEDGGLIVRFRCGGLLEIAWHLFTWGENVRVIAPERLRHLMVDQLSRALLVHGHS